MLPNSNVHHEATLSNRRKHFVSKCIYRALVNIWWFHVLTWELQKQSETENTRLKCCNSFYSIRGVYTVFQNEPAQLVESVLWVNLHWYNQTWLCQKVNGYRDNEAKNVDLQFHVLYLFNLVCYSYTAQDHPW